MLTLKTFNAICRVFAVYSSNFVTPMQVLERLRWRNKLKEIELLSLAMEEIPGNSNCVIRDFIDILRMKVVVQ